MRQEQQVPLILEVGDITKLTTEESQKMNDYIERDVIMDVRIIDAGGEVMAPVGFIPAVYDESTGALTTAAIVTVVKNGSVVKVSAQPITYNFTSYAADKTTELATGKVNITGEKTEFNGDEFQQVVVIANSVPDFVGRTYWVDAAAVADGTTKYSLVNDLGDPTGMWVTISPEA